MINTSKKITGSLFLFFLMGTTLLTAQDSGDQSSTKNKKDGINIHIPNPLSKEGKRAKLEEEIKELEAEIEKSNITIANLSKETTKLIDKQNEVDNDIALQKQKINKLKGENDKLKGDIDKAGKEYNKIGRNTAYAELLKHIFSKPFDAIIAMIDTKDGASSIGIYNDYLRKSNLQGGEKSKIEAKIKNIEYYFSAKEVLNKPFIQTAVNNATADLSRIGESSKRVNELKDGLKYYGRHSEKFNKLLSERGDDDFSAKIMSYLRNREINSLSEFNKYQYLSKQLIALMSE